MKGSWPGTPPRTGPGWSGTPRAAARTVHRSRDRPDPRPAHAPREPCAPLAKRRKACRIRPRTARESSQLQAQRAPLLEPLGLRRDLEPTEDRKLCKRLDYRRPGGPQKILAADPGFSRSTADPRASAAPWPRRPALPSSLPVRARDLPALERPVQELRDLPVGVERVRATREAVALVLVK